MKKVLLTIAGVGSIGLFIFCLTIIKPDLLGLSANTWFSFQSNASRTGYSPDSAPNKAEIAWTFNLKAQGTQKGVILGSVAISEDKVIFGARDGKVHALNLKTGKELWTFKGNKSFGESSPTIYDGKVYIGCLDNFVYALDVNNGQRIWRYQTGGAIKSSPVIYKNNVIIGSEDGYLYALDRTKGTRVWKEQVGDKVSGAPAIYKDKIYVGVATSTEDRYDLYCLKAVNAERVWSQETEMSAGFTDPVIANDLVYVGNNNGVMYAFKYSDGMQVWSKEAGSALNAAAFAANIVYATNDNGQLVRFNKDNGIISWRYTSGSGTSATPIIAQNKICFGNIAGYFSCVDSSGAQVWKKKLAGEISAPAAASNGLIIVVSHNESDSIVTAFGKYTK